MKHSFDCFTTLPALPAFIYCPEPSPRGISDYFFMQVTCQIVPLRLHGKQRCYLHCSHSAYILGKFWSHSALFLNELSLGKALAQSQTNTFQVNKDLFNELGICKSTSCHERKVKGSSGKIWEVLGGCKDCCRILCLCPPWCQAAIHRWPCAE